MYFKQFFSCLEKTSAFIASIFKTSTEAVPQMFSLKKAFCCRYVAYLEKNNHAEMGFQ